MGGPGSGSYMRLGARRSTDEALRLDIRKLHREGFLTPGMEAVHTWRGRNGTSRIGFHVEGDKRAETLRLAYMVKGEAQARVMHVPMEWTPCTFGGERPWGVCPRCGRRIAVLYGGQTFACRDCRNLAYASTRQDADMRSLVKTQRIRQRLGGSPAMTEPFPERPKGMHHRTYWRLFAKAHRHHQRWVNHLTGHLSALTRRREQR